MIGPLSTHLRRRDVAEQHRGVDAGGDGAATEPVGERPDDDPAQRPDQDRRDVDAVFAAAARTHSALEINAFPDRMDLNDELLRRAREHRVVFAIDTDAHAVPHLDNIRYGIAIAQRGWISADQVINTWPLDRLRKFPAKGRR